MPIRVALQHRTSYRFDRLINLSPHEIRLRPAAHCRTLVPAYSLRVTPEKHFLNWQQDVFGNWLARLVFLEPTTTLDIQVDLVAEMTAINPFDFFVADEAAEYPFTYAESLHRELLPFLEGTPTGPHFEAWFKKARRELLVNDKIRTLDLLVALNHRLNQDIRYVLRMEPGVQTPEETLTSTSGSCRDSAWLLVHLLRRFGLAARFVSGYLIQLKADIPALDGPSGAEQDFTDLHAWAEVYLPGAGWIGLDPTSGLLAGEGHLPLSCTASPSTAAAVTGAMDPCESTLDFSMSVTRLVEDARVTYPYTDDQWQSIRTLGDAVDVQLQQQDVRLTMGGEPTFVSIDDMDGAEWNITALSPKKLSLAQELLQRLQTRFSTHALLHYGQGKWYPGEPLPRWALSCIWRTDGVPLWRNPALIAMGSAQPALTVKDARRFAKHLTKRLGLPKHFINTAYEDVTHIVGEEDRWPVNFDPLTADLTDGDERRRMARLIKDDLATPAGYVLPLKPALRAVTNKGVGLSTGWRSSLWPLRRKHLFLMPGDSPLGLRLPLNALPWVAPEDQLVEFPADPFQVRSDLPTTHTVKTARQFEPSTQKDPREIIHTALAVEVRDGVLYVFLPPIPLLEDWVELISAVEDTADTLNIPLRVEGYMPPEDPRIRLFKITPDPGVIEVNIQPASSWPELLGHIEALYAEARLCRLGTEKFMLDGRHMGTGGGNHVTLGGATPADSPLLRRPDVLQSLITYWQHHPALSYLFSGLFIGPTSQAPRIDEARHDSLYELEIAFQQMGQHSATQPWLVDRLLRHLLVDLTGNTHRAEFCIDKLYSPDSPTGRLGLLEFRGFEMPPHAQMSALQMLLLRALVARFWRTPYHGRLIRWGTALHDRFMLPHYVAADLQDVVLELRAAGFPFEMAWFAPFIEFRFPRYGTAVYQSIEIELRQAIEPWHVLGEEVSQSGTSRYVDSSLERLQVKVRGITDGRHIVVCNGRRLPLTPTGVQGESVAGVRYKAWNPYSSLHPTIGVQSPLVFDVMDTWSQRAIGGCTYHVVHPGGRGYDTFPVNAYEAESRRFARFSLQGHTQGPLYVSPERPNADYPHTLDLRRMEGF